MGMTINELIQHKMKKANEYMEKVFEEEVFKPVRKFMWKQHAVPIKIKI